LKLLSVLVAFVMVFSYCYSSPPNVLDLFHVCSSSWCWSFPNVLELLLVLLFSLVWFLMNQRPPSPPL
jgi:hypothetical protein